MLKKHLACVQVSSTAYICDGVLQTSANVTHQLTFFAFLDRAIIRLARSRKKGE